MSPKNFGYMKYVRLENNEILFADIDVIHSNIAPGKKVISAGTIEIRSDTFRISNYGSGSLKVESLPDDPELIEKALNKKHKLF